MTSGKHIRGILNYNENKVKEGVAKCIMAHKFGCDVTALTFSDKLNRFRKATMMNPKVKTNAVHISLNFDVTEKLNDEQFNSIALTYMNKIGFGGQPFLVYRHHDAAHPHVHLITTNIQSDGKRIDIHNIGRNQSEKARKEIELEFGLVQAQSRKKPDHSIIPINIEKPVYGKSETKRNISNVVRMVTRSYKYTSLPELNAVLRQFNVIADRGSEGTQMYARKGLLYSLLDKKGKRIGVPIKASSIYGKPTLMYLEKQFRLNEILRKPLKENLKASINQVLKKLVTKEAFIKKMSDKGVFVLFRENDEGRTYGISFVDNKNKVVFNGSDLGKSYGAKGLLERLSNKKDGSSPITKSILAGPDMDKEQAHELGLINLIDDLSTAQAYDYSSPDAAMKRRRKKKKRKGRSH